MAEQKVSRKALKTKKQISTVLAELLQEKELRDITVQEIADKADVSRTTVYNYYLDVLCSGTEAEQRSFFFEMKEVIRNLDKREQSWSRKSADGRSARR